VSETSVDYVVHSLCCVPSSARFTAIGSNPKGGGILAVYSLNGRELEQSGSTGTGNPLRCSTFDVCDMSERQLCSGDYSGNLSFWDVETFIAVTETKAHSDMINDIDGGGIGSSQILTGGRDGEAKLWDRRTLDKPTVRMLPDQMSARRDCWSVSHAGADRHIVAAGFDNGDVKVFDCRNMKILWETSVARGVSSLGLCGISGSLFLAAGTVLGKMYLWNVTSPTETVQVQLDKSTVWDTKQISTDTKTFVTCMGSGALCVITPSETTGLTCSLNHQVSEPPVSCLASSPDKPGLLITSSFDNIIRLFYYTGLK